MRLSFSPLRLAAWYLCLVGAAAASTLKVLAAGVGSSAVPGYCQPAWAPDVAAVCAGSLWGASDVAHCTFEHCLVADPQVVAAMKGGVIADHRQWTVELLPTGAAQAATLLRECTAPLQILALAAHETKSPVRFAQAK